MIELTYFDILNIPAILMLGVVTSFQDLKEGKIRNKWIIISVLYSFFSLGLTALLLKMGGSSINPEYVKIFFTNLLFSLLFAVFIWLCKLWSAGDAKLFVAYAALIPLTTYKWQVMALFPSYILLINTFTPIFIFFLARMLMRLNPKILWGELKKSLQPKLLFNFAIFVFGFSYINNLLFGLLQIESNYLLNMVFLLFIMIFFSNALKIELVKVSVVFSVIRLVMDIQSVFSIGFWLAFLLQMSGFVIASYFVLNLGSKIFSSPVYIEKLSPGMCLAEDIIEEKGVVTKKSTISLSFLQSIFTTISSKSLLSDYTNLSKEDVENIKKLHSEGKLKDHQIFIYEKISFAIFMLGGVLITLIFGGDILVAIKVLVEKFI